MRAEDLEPLRKHMLAVIAASAFELRGAIGKNALDERVMTAMRKVPRHEFVPIELQPYAYDNIPLPIGFAKTISQPFVVALMTDLLDIKAEKLRDDTGNPVVLRRGPQLYRCPVSAGVPNGPSLFDRLARDRTGCRTARPHRPPPTRKETTETPTSILPPHST